MIRGCYIAQAYVSTVSIVAPVLLASLTPFAKGENFHAQWFLILISIHLAVTLGLFKAFKVERSLSDGLKFESAFYLLLRRFEFQVAPFDGDDRLRKYFEEYAAILNTAYEGEVSAVPSVGDHTAKNNS